MIDQDEWTSIEGFPDYEISSSGRVYNKHRRQEVFPVRGRNDFPVVSLINPNTGRQTTRSLPLLVATAFVENPYDPHIFDTAMQLNGNNFDCSIENLVWRPRWFAIRYKRQFGDPDYHNWTFPIRCVTTGELETGIYFMKTYGILLVDLVNSINGGADVFPDRLRFRLRVGEPR